MIAKRFAACLLSMIALIGVIAVLGLRNGPVSAQDGDEPTPEPLAAPPGQLIVGDDTGLYTMNADGSERIYLVQNDEVGCWLRDGKWSPDNTQIVFTRICGGSDPTDWRSANRSAVIEVYDVESQDTTILLPSDGTSQDYVGSWHPDGTQLVIYSNRGTSFIYNLFLLDIETEELVQLTQFDSNAGRATFDPTGEYILYNRYDTTEARWDIRALAVDDPANEILVAPGLTPNWSPDGGWIVYATERNASTDSADIFVLSTDCIYENTACDPTLARNITYTPEISEREPLWSADQTQLVYLRNNSPTPGTEVWDVVRQEVKTGRLVFLSDTPDVSERITDWQHVEVDELVDIASELPVVVSVNTSTLNLRSGPSTGAAVAGQPVRAGQLLFVQATNPAGDWYYIVLPADGTRAWVYGPYTTIVEGDPTALPQIEE